MKDKMIQEKNSKFHEEQMKINLIKKQQTEWNKLSNERKIKNFTYNYDGTMLMVYENYKERLPPAQLVINYDVKIPLKGKDARGSNRRNLATKFVKGPPLNLNPKIEGDIINNDNEQIEPNEGVVIRYNGILKKGRHSISSVSNLDLTNRDLKLSRADYNKLVKGGNLSREKDNQQLNEIYLSPLNKNRSHDGRQLNWDITLKPNLIKEFTIHSTLALNTMGKVKIDSKEGFDNSLMSKISNIITNVQKKNIQIKNTNPNSNDIMDEIDKFNQTLITNKDWGKVRGGSSFPMLNPNPHISNRVLNSYQRTRSNNLRERLLNFNPKIRIESRENQKKVNNRSASSNLIHFAI